MSLETGIDSPASKYVAAHIRRCNLCRRHDRHVGEVSMGVEARYTPKQLARYAAHVRNTLARIKLAIEADEVRARN